MPFNTLTVVPSVDAEKTPSDVSMGIISSNFIRWRDRIPEKRGGWTLYANIQFPGVIREIHGWQGLNVDKHLGVGTTTGLFVLSSGGAYNITPQSESDSIAVSLSTVIGSNLVNIVDNTYTGQLPYNTVVIQTPVSVGGVTLFGAYQVNENTGSNSYNVVAAIPATSTVTNGGAVATFTTVSGSPQVTVTLADHTYYVGQDAAFPISTSGGWGNYPWTICCNVRSVVIYLHHQCVESGYVVGDIPDERGQSRSSLLGDSRPEHRGNRLWSWGLWLGRLWVRDRKFLYASDAHNRDGLVFGQLGGNSSLLSGRRPNLHMVDR